MKIILINTFCINLFSHINFKYKINIPYLTEHFSKKVNKDIMNSSNDKMEWNITKKGSHINNEKNQPVWSIAKLWMKHWNSYRLFCLSLYRVKLEIIQHMWHFQGHAIQERPIPYSLVSCHVDIWSWARYLSTYIKELFTRKFSA